MKKILSLIKIIGISFLSVSFIMQLVQLYYAYPSGTVLIMYNFYGEYFFESILFICSIPFVLFVIINLVISEKSKHN